MKKSKIPKLCHNIGLGKLFLDKQLLEKIFERQTKATLEVKTRHFVTTFEAVKSIKMLRWPHFSKALCH